MIYAANGLERDNASLSVTTPPTFRTHVQVWTLNVCPSTHASRSLIVANHMEFSRIICQRLRPRLYQIVGSLDFRFKGLFIVEPPWVWQLSPQCPRPTRLNLGNDKRENVSNALRLSMTIQSELAVRLDRLVFLHNRHCSLLLSTFGIFKIFF